MEVYDSGLSSSQQTPPRRDRPQFAVSHQCPGDSQPLAPQSSSGGVGGTATEVPPARSPTPAPADEAPEQQVRRAGSGHHTMRAEPVWHSERHGARNSRGWA